MVFLCLIQGSNLVRIVSFQLLSCMDATQYLIKNVNILNPFNPNLNASVIIYHGINFLLIFYFLLCFIHRIFDLYTVSIVHC